MKTSMIVISLYVFTFCGLQVPKSPESYNHNYSVKDTLMDPLPDKIDSILTIKDKVARSKAIDTIESEPLPAGSSIDVKSVNPEELISFAETLVGTPYVYGSTDPAIGFDCSGFITYVFNKFNINVPRSSSQFSKVGKTIQIEEAKRGDIILFTNPGFTNASTTLVGHMGLVLTNNAGVIDFIHSTSGKAMSVAITPLNEHYKKRFVRISRIFPQND